MQFANIEWCENKGTYVPYSLDFNDVYFNTDDGLAETEHVFITHNQLPQRFSNANLSSFTIIETGFGTGLNFLAVSALWLQLAPKNATLHYIGIEKMPLSLADLARAHALWPQLTQITDAWLLDGFAPAKNAAMWSSEVFAQMTRLSKIGTTFATFTSAGHVKRGLQRAGFAVSKHKGFGKKREMLSGIFTGKG